MREYEEGVDAFWSGQSLDNNPYSGWDYRKSQNWRMGWHYAYSVSLAQDQGE